MGQLNCFVAMAIREGADVDALHFKVIEPLLQKKLGINAQRIDERHHNENIDIRILAEIERADFVVADLTYERPSVYFEAGYALARGIPVVYSCRADHLHRDGKYQVHFDLRQRNIVTWRSPQDRRFQRRFVARVRHSIAPLLRDRAQQAALTRERDAFASLSPETRIDRLREVAHSLLRRSGFTAPDLGSKYDSRACRGYRATVSTLKTVNVLVYSSNVTEKSLSYLRMWAFPTTDSGIPEKERKKRSRADHIIVVSEHSVPRSRVERVFTDFTPAPGKSWTLYDASSNSNRTRRSLHVIDNVRSLRDLTERGKAVVSAV